VSPDSSLKTSFAVQKANGTVFKPFRKGLFFSDVKVNVVPNTSDSIKK